MRVGACSTCGVKIGISRTSAAEPRCRECRHSPHGTIGRYGQGCRCGECRTAQRVYMRDYYARRQSSANPIVPKSRPIESRSCEACGAGFNCRRGAPTRFCSLACRSSVRRRPKSKRFRIAKSIRVAIHERDGWACMICGDPVEPDSNQSSSRYPTLDHIIPRTLGGSDDPSNLRTAHRLCNSVRGDLTYYDDAGVVAFLAA